MNSRERVFAALEHKQPDRCPVDLWLEDSTIKKLMSHFQVDSDEDLYDILDVDLQFVRPDSLLPKPEILPDGSWIEHTGVQYRIAKNNYCEYVECISHPLEFVEEIEDFEQYDKWMDASMYDWEHFSEKIGNRHEKRVIKLEAGGVIFQAWELRGMDQSMMDMIINPEIAHYILEKQCNFLCDYVRHALDAAGDKIDIVYIFDDIATQSGLIMSPEMLEEFVYSYHRRICEVIKSYGKKILFHSCGSVVSQIGKLRDLPIDILNPLQPLAAGMDFAEIKDTWGDTLCFHGGIDVQRLLPNGSVEEIKSAVKRAISILGRNGGYILTSAHAIQNDTPIENIIAMYDQELRIF